ncbi:ubiquinol-cytochrome c reductase iron-sulfur subunit N-terminal domain-containing protein, partial [Yoonia ponticola]|uniref:ubiquinol-cytochrome c reductase iron-sulfur subunit N-terminal domain-containing protein n=1 Tax=Yoonia ponticola TaxID=1524255 RepID=UPI001FE5F015
MDTQTPQLRRDFLYYATAGTGAVAVGAAVWPLLNGSGQNLGVFVYDGDFTAEELPWMCGSSSRQL